MLLDGKRILITGGTGSLGKVLTRRILQGELGTPDRVIIFSRDEAKQHAMRMQYLNRTVATDEIIYENFRKAIQFRIGDVRDYSSICSVLRDVDIVFNAAALKQVPTCEYFPYQAVLTNISGPYNIVRAISEHHYPVETVIGISTDKACKPINVMGMTKAIQERLFIAANTMAAWTRWCAVRYGNVLASRGSVIPLFRDQIRNGGPVTLTHPQMTRFLLSLNNAVDTVFAALRNAKSGEIFVPRAPSATVENIAKALIEEREIAIKVIGVRPGEKLHEILVSEEEINRTDECDGYYVILPMLPELSASNGTPHVLDTEFSSASNPLGLAATRDLLAQHKLLLADADLPELQELLR